LLRSLPEITIETRWKEAIQLFSATEAYDNSPELQRIDPIDLLLEFENYIKELEQLEQRQNHEKMMMERRKERLARKEMKRVIKGLIDSGKFTAMTTWREFCGMVRNLDCFISMITANPDDPTPLDFYWDALDVLQTAYMSDRNIILRAIGPEVPKEIRKFTDQVRRHDAFSKIRDLQHIELAFKELSLRPSPPEIQVDPESIDRKAIEKYKHLIKHWSGPELIKIDSTWEQFRPLLAQHEEFKAIQNESVRRTYFDKYIVHIRKKAGLPPKLENPEHESPEEGEVVEEDERYYRR